MFLFVVVGIFLLLFGIFLVLFGLRGFFVQGNDPCHKAGGESNLEHCGIAFNILLELSNLILLCFRHHLIQVHLSLPFLVALLVFVATHWCVI